MSGCHCAFKKKGEREESRDEDAGNGIRTKRVVGLPSFPPATVWDARHARKPEDANVLSPGDG